MQKIAVQHKLIVERGLWGGSSCHALHLLEHALLELDLRHLYLPAFAAAAQIFQIAVAVDENNIVLAILRVLAIGGEVSVQRCVLLFFERSSETCT